MELKKILERYYKECLGISSQKNSNYCKSAVDFFADKPLTYQTMTAYVSAGISKNLAKDYSLSTIYTQLNLISAAFNYCEKAGYICTTENIFIGQKLLPQLKCHLKLKRRKECNFVQVKREIFENFIFRYLINDNEDIKLKEISALAYYTGMRFDEICRLKWSDIKTNWILITQEKGRKNKKIPLSKNVLNITDKIKKEKSEYIFFKPDNSQLPTDSDLVGKSIRRHWVKYANTNPNADIKFSLKNFSAAYVQNTLFNEISCEDIKKTVKY